MIEQTNNSKSSPVNPEKEAGATGISPAVRAALPKQGSEIERRVLEFVARKQ
jgi:hypothetical protein